MLSNVVGFHGISDRIIIVKLFSKPFNLSIIQVYAPTSASREEGIEAFYNDLDDAYKQSGSPEMVVVMGDLSAKVRTEQDPSKVVVGQHSLGERNERGDLWVDWCTTHEQVIMNTWFQHEKRQLYTWKCPDDTTRNQIDYITINQRFRNSILQVKGYPGADCDSDRVPVMATMRVKLRQMNITKTVKKLLFHLLRTDDEYTTQFQRHISEHMESINNIDNVEDRYIKFRNALTESAQQVLPDIDRTAKQKWMTALILQKMNQRRLAK